MTSPIPRDRQLLLDATRELEDAASRSGLEASPEIRLRLLEGAASRIGSYSLKEFDFAIYGADAPALLTSEAAYDYTAELSEAIQESSLHPSLALAVLGDSELNPLTRRRQGRYLTDSRLAFDLTSSALDGLNGVKSVLDPACGSGVLLVATALQFGSSQSAVADFARNALWGVDRDALVIKAA